MPNLEILVRARDEASKQFNNISQNLEGMKVQLQAVGVAMTAMGVAGLTMIDSAREMNAQLGVTALNLGTTSEEMRSLALDATNVTFPLHEVISSFDLLARAGVENTEILESTAIAFDMLGDAVGMGASDVTAKMVPAMKTFGLSAEEVASKSDLMTNLVRNSTVSMDNFGSVIGYITPELVTMGLTLEDTVALMAIMEGKGMSGEVATRAFRTAITEATREQISLQDALGITSIEMATYRDTLKGIEGMTEQYAEAANEQYGIMDKLKQKWEELTLIAGSYLTPLEPILVAMTALGPLMIFLSTSIGITTIKWIGHTIAVIASTVALQFLGLTALAVTGILALLTVGLLAIVGGFALFALNKAKLQEYNDEMRRLADEQPRVAQMVLDSRQAMIDQGTATKGTIQWMEKYGEEMQKRIDLAIKDIAVTDAQKEAKMSLADATQYLIDKEKALVEALGATQEYFTNVFGPAWAERGGMERELAMSAYFAERYPHHEVMPQSIESLAKMVVGSYQHGGEVPTTGLAMVHRGETIIPSGGITIPIYLDGELIQQAVIRRLTDQVRLEGGLV